jgi:predicted nuclease of predicted toxin-antitoxin system
MDENVSREVVLALRRRGVDVLTAQEDGLDATADVVLLTRATSLGRALFTHDKDLLLEASRRMHSGDAFSGVIYVHQIKISVGQTVRDLEFLSLAGEPSDFLNTIHHLPLR